MGVNRFLYLNITVCRVEQVTKETTVCDRHTDGVDTKAWFCDMITVKVDVHKLMTTVGDGPVEPTDQKMADTNCKENII